MCSQKHNKKKYRNNSNEKDKIKKQLEDIIDKTEKQNNALKKVIKKIMSFKKIKNITLRFAKVLIFIVLTCYPFICHTQNIYAIIVAGTNMEDETLKKGITKSFNDIIKEIENIPNYTNLNLFKYYLYGNNFNSTKLKDVINNLQCDNNDVIFFYYLGHGFRYEYQTNQWPNFIVGYNVNDYQELNNVKVSYSWIIQQLKSKGARLTIMVAECCNNNINAPVPVEKEIKGLASLDFNIRNPKRYSELFEDSQGVIIASSSKPGETSVVSEEDGGIFTEALTEEIKEQTGISNSADWNTIFEKAKERTCSLINIGSIILNKKHEQHPQFEINIFGVNRFNTNWNGIIASNQNVFQQQPKNFQYNIFYRPQQFVVARIVNFNNNDVFFLMSDNYIVKYDPFTGRLFMIGYRAASMQPQMFQWDFVNPVSPYQTLVYGVDYQGFVWTFDNYYGWQRIGAVYY